jgi:hypothetical protein
VHRAFWFTTLTLIVVYFVLGIFAHYMIDRSGAWGWLWWFPWTLIWGMNSVVVLGGLAKAIDREEA